MFNRKKVGKHMTEKKTKTITGIARIPDDMLVQKSLPLFGLWRSKLTLAEFKILDTYLARIDSHKPNKRIVRLEKGELEQLLGVKKINTPELKERLKHLMESVVEVNEPTKTKAFRFVSLFEQAECEQDEYGLWQIDLECTQRAMKYFFNVENLGYLRYKLRCVVALTSRYSYILFAYLESNRFRRSWEITVDELKQILHCEDEETYREFKRFNDRLLKRCYKELTEKTECQFTYEPIKKGRIVRTIRFTVKTLSKTSLESIDKSQITVKQCQNEVEKELWESTIDEFNFTNEQIAELREVLICIPEYKMPQSTACYDAIELRQYHYMQIKVAEIKRRANIKNIFPYLIKMLKHDANIQ